MIIDQYLDMMSVREKVGQLLMSKPYTSSDESMAKADRKAITELCVGSVGGSAIGADGRSIQDLSAYVNRLQGFAESTRLGIPLLINADFEHGVGQKSAYATEFPQAMGIGATRSVEDAREIARITGREARSLGILWNNAPIADVNTNAENPIIGWRSFGDDPDHVGDFVEAQVDGYKSESVIATVSHFPGHGAAKDDSHAALPHIDCTRSTFEDVHLAPFRRAVRAGVDAVMTGHVVVECLDDDRPASLSPTVHEILREDLSFDGVVVSDALRMKSISERWDIEEAALMAIKAGSDVPMALCPFQTLVDISDHIVEAVESGDLSTSRLDEAVRRVLNLKLAYGQLRKTTVFGDPEAATDVCGNVEHRETAKRIARDSITLASNDGALPFSEGCDGRTLVAGLQSDVLASAVEPYVADPDDVLVSGVEPTDVPDADRIIIRSDGHTELVEALTQRDVPVVVVESGTPYAAIEYRSLPDATIFAYDTTFSWALEKNDYVRAAVVDVMFGHPPKGRLPVTIDGDWSFGYGLTYASDGTIKPVSSSRA